MEFTTTEGVTLTIKPVSQIKIQRVRDQINKEFLDKGAQLTPPAYTVTDVAGTVENFFHTTETIKTANLEEKTLWDKYLEDTTRLEMALNERVTRLMLLQGVECGDVPPTWLEEQAYFGVPINTNNPLDLKLDYITLEILKTPEDQMGCIAAIMKASSAGIDKEALEAAEKSFRHRVREESRKRAREASAQLDGQAG